MLSAATRVLRLRFVSPPAPNEAPSEGPLLDFVAYTHGYSVAGMLRLEADRLTDLLNGADELDLADVVYLGLDGRIEEAARAHVDRADLVAVKAGDPRGNAAFRHPTRQLPIVVGAGPYVMHGYLHSRPGADGMAHLSRRPSMVPLTDATIIYETNSILRRDQASTLVVNRDAADWIRPAKEDELARIGVRGPLA
jgi:hypothetical protein